MDDAEAMIDVGMAAFAKDLMNISMFDWTTAPPEEAEEYRQYRINMSKLRMEGRGKHWFKAIDDSTGKIVGFTGLYSPDADTSALSSMERPKCINREVDQEIHTILETVKKECMGDREDYWYVQSMAVHPDYQGRSIARKLLERGLQGADQAGQDVYLEGTAAAQPLYYRCGFEDLRDIDLLKGAYRMKVMIRRPKSN